MTRILGCFLLLAIASFSLAHAEPEIVYLWDGVAPGSEGQTGEEIVRQGDSGDHVISNVHRPSLTAYLPASSAEPATAVLIIPGGAHREIWSDHEGHNVARWLSARGIAGFILKYRLLAQKGSPYKLEYEVTDGQARFWSSSQRSFSCREMDRSLL